MSFVTAYTAYVKLSPKARKIFIDVMGNNNDDDQYKRVNEYMDEWQRIIRKSYRYSQIKLYSELLNCCFYYMKHTEELREIYDNINQSYYMMDHDLIKEYLDTCQSIIQSSDWPVIVAEYSHQLEVLFFALYDRPNENGVYPAHVHEEREKECFKRFAHRRSISECPYCGRMGLLFYMGDDYDCYVCGQEYNSFADDCNPFGR